MEAFMKREKVTISSGDEIIPLCIELLISRFQSNNGAERKKAREALVKIGKPAVPYVVKLLEHYDFQVRWEACKTLGGIRDAKTAKQLVEMLLDEDMDVRWVASDALIELEHHAIVPLLEIIEKHFESVVLRDAAHHILHSLKELKILDEKTEAVLDAINIKELSSKAAFMASHALDHVRTHVPMRRRQTFARQ
jgi:hypothetical protein